MLHPSDCLSVFQMLGIAKYIIAAPIGILGVTILIPGMEVLIEALKGRFGGSSISSTTFIMLPGGIVVDGQWIWVVALFEILLGLILLLMSLFVVNFKTKNR